MEIQQVLNRWTVNSNKKRDLITLHKLIMMGLESINLSNRTFRLVSMRWSRTLMNFTVSLRLQSNKNKLYKIHMKCIRKSQQNNNKNKLYKTHMKCTHNSSNSNHKNNNKKKFITHTPFTRKCRQKPCSRPQRKTISKNRSSYLLPVVETSRPPLAAIPNSKLTMIGLWDLMPSASTADQVPLNSK